MSHLVLRSYRRIPGACIFINVCTLCGSVVRERGRTGRVYPGTPCIIVSNLSVTLCPIKKDFTRFEIASSQILMLLTHSQELCMDFLISERGEKMTGRERLDTDTRIFRAHVDA